MFNSKMIGTNGAAAAEPATIGEYRDGGIVYWIDPLDSTTGFVISVNDRSSGKTFGPSSPQVPNNSVDLRDSKANTDQIIGIIGSSTNYSAGACRSYLGGGWDLPTFNSIAEWRNNKAVIDQACIDNGGSAIQGVSYGSSTTLDTYGYGVRVYNPGSGSSTVGLVTTNYPIRAVKTFGSGNFTQFISLRFDEMLNSYSGGRRQLLVYWDNDGTWTQIANSGEIYGGMPSYNERSLGLPEGQITLKFVARVGYGQWDQAGIRIYKNKGAFNLSNVNLTSEGTNTYSESTDYYQFQTQAEPGLWKDAVMYATYS